MRITKNKGIKKEEKKRLKAELKLRKKKAKVSHSSGLGDGSEKKSLMVKFAESIRGIIYVITGVSILTVIILGQSGAFVTLNDIVENLMLVTLGKFILIVIALALIIYGFKNLRFLK